MAQLVNGDLLFKCHSSDMTIPQSYVNDGYCDCKDGSDEPDTHVCNDGWFVCKNEMGADG